ncbi:MAG TPA: hypothetical protein VGL34_09495 [Steroidobacteraceae bacterium]|jgi:uncharacterized integral membrane protein
MRLRTLLAIIVAVLIAAFLVVNWQVLAAPAKVSFVFGSIETPIGVVLLAICAPVLLALMVYVGMWQSTALLESRRQAKELQAQRILADNAEASRFTELGALIRSEITGLDQRLQAAIDAMRGEFRDIEGSIAATLGEMDDRIRRLTDPKAHQPVP